MGRDWRAALLVAALVHAGVLLMGSDSLDAKPLALGHGMGPRGDFKVVALTPDQARLLLARRGSERVPILVEAGGAGRSATTTPIPLLSPRPQGPSGSSLGGGPTLGDLGAGRSGQAPTRETLRESVLGAPESLPAAPTPESGSPNQPNLAGSESADDPTEGPDESGAGELAGSGGQQARDTGAADGDRAIGLDTATLDALSVIRISPAYPPELAARGVKGIVRFEFTVNSLGRAENIVRLQSGGHWLLDDGAERALRLWRFPLSQLSARGWVGKKFRVSIGFGTNPP
ncbi:energy transducer TonB [Engelhardtia mirabilis]|uniref:Gram-negative bacterial tonB protein n=1 Tax=Engelhardtia mirabilis TaxID=2528011 RepID=A0A518BNP2_9BACT|nr:Gram-negative bacterial tonB protein [Planctomycetes bacterium Pla133]QDV02891.1 Gram-negative bacterial tonB protein [Planctomycetes bacterium Pla86]